MYVYKFDQMIALSSASEIKEEIVSNYDLARSNNDVSAEYHYKDLIDGIDRVIEYIKEK